MLERFNEAVQNILAIQDEIILAFWQTFVMVGISTVLGVLLGTVLGIFVIPILFIVFQTLQEKIKPMKFDRPQEEIEHNNSI